MDDEGRDELRQRARKALTEEPANDFIKGWLAAWSEVLRVLDEQDAMRALVPRDAG